jgi:thiol-disulfide isomerase/thioredoxin
MPSRGRRFTPFVFAAALLSTALLSACGAAATSVPTGPPHSQVALKAQLAKLRSEANMLLDGGPAAFEARLADLRGAPIVVNQWASWCGPCRFEFPFFQHLASRFDGRVAFLGVNSQDNRGDAEAFLKQLPVPYPHFYDEDTSIARLFRGGRAWPTTAFYDAKGKLTHTHVGAYATEGKLDQDIRTYALHG